MNIHKEGDIIWIEPNDRVWEIQPDGTLNIFDPEDTSILTVYKAHADFYIHSGQEEFISYNTVAPDGRILEVNRFKAVFPNPGIKRVDSKR